MENRQLKQLIYDLMVKYNVPQDKMGEVYEEVINNLYTGNVAKNYTGINKANTVAGYAGIIGSALGAAIPIMMAMRGLNTGKIDTSKITPPQFLRKTLGTAMLGKIIGDKTGKAVGGAVGAVANNVPLGEYSRHSKDTQALKRMIEDRIAQMNQGSEKTAATIKDVARNYLDAAKGKGIRELNGSIRFAKQMMKDVKKSNRARRMKGIFDDVGKFYKDIGVNLGENPYNDSTYDEGFTNLLGDMFDKKHLKDLRKSRNKALGKQTLALGAPLALGGAGIGAAANKSDNEKTAAYKEGIYKEASQLSPEDRLSLMLQDPEYLKLKNTKNLDKKSLKSAKLGAAVGGVLGAIGGTAPKFKTSKGLDILAGAGAGSFLGILAGHGVSRLKNREAYKMNKTTPEKVMESYQRGALAGMTPDDIRDTFTTVHPDAELNRVRTTQKTAAYKEGIYKEAGAMLNMAGGMGLSALTSAMLSKAEINKKEEATGQLSEKDKRDIKLINLSKALPVGAAVGATWTLADIYDKVNDIHRSMR